MNRRHFFTVAASSSVAMLAACSSLPNGSATTSLDTVIADVSTIAKGLLGVMPIIGNMPALSAATVATIGTAIANLQVLAEQVKTINDLVGAQSIVQQLATDLDTVISALAAIPTLPPPVAIALQAAAILLPILEALVNLILPPKFAARAAKVQLTPDQARGILRDLAAHK